jgi:hypothetical protein
MAGWRFLFVATVLLGGTAGCCSYCDSTYARRHPVAAPAYGNGCVPCQPVQQPCCPCPVGYTPAGTVANSVPPPPPPPGQPVQTWQRAPVNPCCP